LQVGGRHSMDVDMAQPRAMPAGAIDGMHEKLP
jgi:hypothetical protein